MLTVGNEASNDWAWLISWNLKASAAIPQALRRLGLCFMTTQNCTSLDANMDATTGMEGHVKQLREDRALQRQMTTLGARLDKAGQIVTFDRSCGAANRNIKKHSGPKEHIAKRAAAGRTLAGPDYCMQLEVVTRARAIPTRLRQMHRGGVTAQ